MKPGRLLAIMEGIVDGSFGHGTVDFIIDEVLNGKDSDDIMFDVVKRMREKEKEDER